MPDGRWLSSDPALGPPRPGLRPQCHPENRLHLWVLEQHQVWVDFWGNEHEVESMALDDVEGVLSYLREHASLMHALRVCDLSLEAIERLDAGDTSGAELLEEAAQLKELDPHEWLEESPLLRALRRRLEGRRQAA